MVTTPKIAECLTQASIFNTFGGNPMASAVGMAVLEVNIFVHYHKVTSVTTFLLSRSLKKKNSKKIL